MTQKDSVYDTGRSIAEARDKAYARWLFHPYGRVITIKYYRTKSSRNPHGCALFNHADDNDTYGHLFGWQEDKG